MIRTHDDDCIEHGLDSCSCDAVEVSLSRNEWEEVKTALAHMALALRYDVSKYEEADLRLMQVEQIASVIDEALQ